MSIADPEERSQPCPRGHGPEHREFKGNGRWVCYACRNHYAARRRRHRKMSNHRQEGVTTHDNDRRR